MSIYNEYLTGAERELAIEASTFDVEISRLFTMLEMVDLQYDQMVKDAELKVLTESGTYDDLTYLITEAEAEVGTQKKGIFSQIISAIGQLFASIGKKLREIFGLGDANLIVEAPKEEVEKHKQLSSCVSEIQSGVAKIRSGDWSGAKTIFDAIKNKIPKIAAISAGAAAGGALLYKYKKGDLNNIMTTLQNDVNNLQTNLEEMKKKADEGNGVMDSIKSAALGIGLGVVSTLSKSILTFSGNISSFITAAVNKAKGVANNIKDKITGNKGADNQQPADGDAKPEEGNNEPVQPAQDNAEPEGVKYQAAHKNTTYRLLNNGKWQKMDPVNKTWHDISTPPEKLRSAAAAALKNKQVKESTAEELQDILGANYTVEKTVDGFIINEIDSEMFESASRSIFGYDLENEDVLQESGDAFDKELQELAELFERL